MSNTNIKLKCKKKISPPGRYGSFNQYSCTKPVWKDGYCKVHHPEIVEARRHANDKRREERQRNDPVNLAVQWHDALQKIAAGNLDGETQEQFVERCIRIAKEALQS